jgi:hypothetical protein
MRSISNATRLLPAERAQAIEYLEYKPYANGDKSRHSYYR